jgi:taurine--2-oxoglutarate transaminase
VFQGGLTYNAHPVSLSAAIANIEVIKSDNLIEHARKMGIYLHHKLVDLGENHPFIGEVRSIGLFGAIELVKNRDTKEPMAPYGRSSIEMDRLKQNLLGSGLFVYTHFNTILIIPPLIISPDQIDEGISILDNAIRALEREF